MDYSQDVNTILIRAKTHVLEYIDARNLEHWQTPPRMALASTMIITLDKTIDFHLNKSTTGWGDYY